MCSGQLDLGGRSSRAPIALVTLRGAPDDPAHDVRATARGGQARAPGPGTHANRRARAERPPPKAPPERRSRPEQHGRPEHLSYVGKHVLSNAGANALHSATWSHVRDEPGVVAIAMAR
jgi:hypothetical protein